MQIILGKEKSPINSKKKKKQPNQRGTSVREKYYIHLKRLSNNYVIYGKAI